MPTLELTREKALELLELERRADVLPGLSEQDRQNLRELAAEIRRQGVEA